MCNRGELVAFKLVRPNAALASLVGQSSALRSCHGAVVGWS